jgi:hypothetical protein
MGLEKERIFERGRGLLDENGYEERMKFWGLRKNGEIGVCFSIFNVRDEWDGLKERVGFGLSKVYAFRMVNERSGLKVDGGEFACVLSLGQASAFLCFSFKLKMEEAREREGDFERKIIRN